MRAPGPSTGAGLGFLMVTAVGWGLNWTAIKFLLRDWSPLTARGVAGVAAALGLALLAKATGQSLAIPRRDWLKLATAATFNVGGWMGFSSVALLWLRAGEGATIAYTMPIWASLLAWPVLGERPTPLRLAALALGLGGIVVLFSGQGFSLGTEKLPGILLALACALSFAIGTVLTKRAPLQLPPLVVTTWQVGLGCGALGLIGLLTERQPTHMPSATSWAAMAYMAYIPLALCYLTWFAALRRLPASIATLGMLLAPAIGVFGAAATLGEPIGPHQLGGLALTGTGILLAVFGQAPARQPQPAAPDTRHPA